MLHESEYREFERGYLLGLAFTAMLQLDPEGDNCKQLFSNPGGQISQVVDTAKLKAKLIENRQWAPLEEDCKGFFDNARSAISRAGGGLNWGEVGSDFHLTRNRHGSGFWDRGLGALGDELTALARPFGPAELVGFPKEGAEFDPEDPELELEDLDLFIFN